MTVGKRIHAHAHAHIIVRATNGCSLFPDKTLRTIHPSRARRHERKLAREGYAVQRITVPPR